MAKNAAATSALSKILALKPGSIPQFTSPYRPSNISNEEQELADKIGRFV